MRTPVWDCCFPCGLNGTRTVAGQRISSGPFRAPVPHSWSTARVPRRAQLRTASGTSVHALNPPQSVLPLPALGLSEQLAWPTLGI